MKYAFVVMTKIQLSLYIKEGRKSKDDNHII